MRTSPLVVALSLASAAVGNTAPRIAGAQLPDPPHVPMPGFERATVFRAPSALQPPRSALGLWLGAADTLGIRLDRVTADGPAARAGIVAGEHVVDVNGTALRVDKADADDPLLASVPARRLERTIGRLAPGTDVELRVAARDGRQRTVHLRTVAPTSLADGAREPEIRIRRFGSAPDGAPEVRAGDGAFFQFTHPPVNGGPGMRMTDSAQAELSHRMTALADSTRARAAQRPALGLTLAPSASPRDTLGLFVASVVTGGPAERAGVIEGDRVAAINAVDLRTPAAERDDPQAADARRARFIRELERAHAGDRVTLRVWGDARWRTVTATVAHAADVYARTPGNDLRFNGFPGGGPGWELQRGPGTMAFPRPPRPPLPRPAPI